MLTLAKTLKPETQIAYLNKVKKTNVSFLKLCRKSKKENFIYNGEYKRIKKFYKGMMNRVFYINEDVYSDISLTQVPLLTRYETKVWQSLSSTICTTFKNGIKKTLSQVKDPCKIQTSTKKKDCKEHYSRTSEHVDIVRESKRLKMV